jgi:hypothetical protein
MEESTTPTAPPEAPQATETPTPEGSGLDAINKTLATFSEALSVLLDDKNGRDSRRSERETKAAEQAADQLSEVGKLKAERELVKAEREAWGQQRLEASADELRRSRDHAMDRLGVLPQYRSILPPDIDPRGQDGQAALEKFFGDKGAMLRTKEVKPAAADKSAKGGSFAARVFGANGVSNNKMTSLEAIRDNAKAMGIDF